MKLINDSKITSGVFPAFSLINVNGNCYLKSDKLCANFTSSKDSKKAEQTVGQLICITTLQINQIKVMKYGEFLLVLGPFVVAKMLNYKGYSL